MTARWGEITAGEVISPVKGNLACGNPDISIAGISTDSREILPGGIFFALRGDKFDGHDFVHTVVAKGASCIVVDRRHEIKLPPGIDTAMIVVEDTLTALGDMASWWRHQFDVRVAGITGSAGKTTTKEMTAHILALSSETLKNKGNLNNLIGLPLTVFQLENKTAKMVLEMGMNRPGEIGRLTGIADPDVGLITNIGRAHLEGLGDMEGVARAKTELLERMSPQGKVILNGDDDLLMKASSRFKREVTTFGLKAENDVRADGVKGLGKDGTSFVLHFRGDSMEVTIRLPGLHNLYNALAAASIALSMNEPLANIAVGLNRYDGLKGRFKSVSLAKDIILIDDTYNSNPSSLRASLNSAKDMAGGGKRLIVGLGEMLELGDETVQAHLEAGGMVADTGASWFFAMGDHAAEMKNGAIKKGLDRERVFKVETHDEMIKGIEAVLEPGDVIFLKGSRRIGLDSVARGLEERWPKEA